MKNSLNIKTGFWKFLEYALYIYIVLFPFVSLRSFLYGGSSTRAASLILFAIVAGIVFSIFCFRKGSVLAVSKSPILIAASAYLAVLFISALAGMDFHTSFWSVVTRMTGLWYLLHLGFLIFLLSALFQYERKVFDRSVLVLLLSTALYSVLSFLSPEGVGLLFKGLQADAFTFGNSSFAGMYIFGAFLFSIYYAVSSEKKRWWMFLLPVLLLINPNILNSRVWFGDFSQGIIGEARASAYVILASVILLIVIWLISKIKAIKTRKIISYSLFGAVIIGLLFSAFSLLSQNGYLRKEYLANATAVRPIVWDVSGRAIAERPVLGWGIDNFERVFAQNYDNRILQRKFGEEAWLDRAHNIYIDQLVDGGYLGLISYVAVYIVLGLSLIYVVLNSKEKKDRILSAILLAYAPLHFLELQTAFDTSISYFMVAMILASAIAMYSRTRMIMGKKEAWVLNDVGRYSISAIVLVFFCWSLFFGFLPFIQAQFTNGYVRTVGSSEKRLEAFPALFGSPVDEQSFLWRTVNDFKKGIGDNPQVLSDKKKVEMLAKEANYFESEYRKYVERHPYDFRAKLDFADVLIYENLFGVSKLGEAQQILDQAIKMVPQAPQTYWMKSVVYLYSKKFDQAREYARKGLELNPEIETSQEVVQYIDKSIKSFPVVDLYNFKQI